jgi:hypothetical protein
MWFLPRMPWFGLAVLLSLPLLVLAASDPPSILLVKANIPRAKALAVEAALQKGWRLQEQGAGYGIFESDLPPDATDPGRSRLHIHAEFTKTLPGVRVSLTATQLFNPGRANQRAEAVTDLYRLNLDNALASLRHQWRTQALGREEPKPEPKRASSILPPPRPDGGVWRYYAEQQALRAGCEFAEHRLVLTRRTPTGETYEAACYSGRTLTIHCSADICGYH